MRRFLLLISVIAFVASAAVNGRQTLSAEAQLEAARKVEVVDGDLDGAIKRYQAIADQYQKTNRGVAAQALLLTAEGYRKQRSGQTQEILRQIIREYPDQPKAVAQAQAGLGPGAVAGRSPAAQGSHAVERTLWSGADLPKGDIVAVSPDSRSVAYVRSGEGDGALVLRDVATSRDRTLTTAPGPLTRERGEYAVYAAFSRDGKRLAYDWRIQNLEPGANRVKVVDELRIIDLSQPGTPTPRILFRDENTAGYSVRPVGWSPDGERIAVLIGHGDERTRQLGFVSVQDGKLTVLRTLDWRSARGVSLSPDGRYLAYDLPADERTGQRDIFVLASDGSRQVTAVGGPGRDEVVGWSPDGTRLLFTRDDLQMWAQPMVNGAPQGQASIVKPDARGTRFMLTAAGDLFGIAQIDDRAFYRAQVDFATGRSLGPAAVVPEVLPGTIAAEWSPDGRSMASLASIAEELVLSVRSLTTGTAQVVSMALSFFDNNNFQWTPDGRSLLARAADMSGRLGFYRVDVADGTVTPMLLPPPDMNYTRPQLSKDGATLYYIRAEGVPVGAGGLPTGPGRFYVARDLTTGREREILKLERPNAVYGPVSPDGKYIGAANWSKARNGGGPAPDAAWTFSVISTADSTEREIFRFNPPVEFLGGPALEWTPDGRFVVVRKVVGAAREVWAISVADGRAHKLDLGVPNYTGRQIRLSPDGRQIVVQAGNPVRREVRVLERFLPPAAR